MTSDPTTVLRFHPTVDDPFADTFPEAPDGIFSRQAWLPQIGPTSWTIWTHLALRLAVTDDVTITLGALAEACGVSAGVCRRTFTRIESFGIFTPVAVNVWTVRQYAPPVSDRALLRLPGTVAGNQADLIRHHNQTARRGARQA